MQVRAVLWPVLALLLIALFLPGEGEEFHASTIVFFAPSAEQLTLAGQSDEIGLDTERSRRNQGAIEDDRSPH